MLKKLKSKAGLTLTELMVTMLLLSMFSMACLVGITSAFSSRRDYIRISDADILKDTVVEVITQELRMCTNISDVTADGGSEIEYQGGMGLYQYGRNNPSQKAKLELDENGRILKTVYSDDGTPDGKPYTYQVLNYSAYGTDGSFIISDLSFKKTSGAAEGIEVSFKVKEKSDDLELTGADFTVIPLYEKEP